MFGSWDLISDATTRGDALPMLTILDEYTRECHMLRADRALKSSDGLEGIGRAIAEHGSPAYLRSGARRLRRSLTYRPQTPTTRHGISFALTTSAARG
jgi:hypothetical protein